MFDSVVKAFLKKNEEMKGIIVGWEQLSSVEKGRIDLEIGGL